MSTDAQSKLKSLLEAVFEDSVVQPDEREQLEALTKGGELAQDDVRKVFRSFVSAKWGEAMEDGRLTPQERMLLGEIVRELHLPEEALPEQLRLALFND